MKREECPRCGSSVDVMEWVCFGGGENTYRCCGDEPPDDGFWCGWTGPWSSLKRVDP